ncbi:hypothetical protein A2U01_0038659, partial [Trifolium medium]|nr:hypothetical protein [Trifolium medium]
SNNYFVVINTTDPDRGRSSVVAGGAPAHPEI